MYRAFNHHYGVMTHPFTLSDLQNDQTGPEGTKDPKDIANHLVGECAVMQCIGLKDSTGKWIFEQDILRLDFDDGELPMYIAVCFYQGSFGYWEQGVGYPPVFCPWSEWSPKDNVLSDTVIVGNVYEKPDLLIKYEVVTND